MLEPFRLALTLPRSTGRQPTSQELTTQCEFDITRCLAMQPGKRVVSDASPAECDTVRKYVPSQRVTTIHRGCSQRSKWTSSELQSPARQIKHQDAGFRILVDTHCPLLSFSSHSPVASLRPQLYSLNTATWRQSGLVRDPASSRGVSERLHKATRDLVPSSSWRVSVAYPPSTY